MAAVLVDEPREPARGIAAAEVALHRPLDVGGLGAACLLGGGTEPG